MIAWRIATLAVGHPSGEGETATVEISTIIISRIETAGPSNIGGGGGPPSGSGGMLLGGPDRLGVGTPSVPLQSPEFSRNFKSDAALW